MVNVRSRRACRIQPALAGRADVEGEGVGVQRPRSNTGSRRPSKSALLYTSHVPGVGRRLEHVDVERHLVADIVVGDERRLGRIGGSTGGNGRVGIQIGA